MGRPPSIQWYYRQWLGDNKVLAMDWDARAMHFHLLMLSIQENPPGTIPDDDAAIRRWLSLPLNSVESDQVWRRVKPQVLAAWHPEGDRLGSTGMMEAMERQERYRKRYEIGTKKHADHNEDEDSSKEVDVGSKELKTKPTKKTAHVLPEDFVPTEEHYTLAKELGVICDMEFQKMRDWALGKNEHKADWNAVFRNWLRNSLTYGGHRATPAGQISKAQRRVDNTRANLSNALAKHIAKRTGHLGGEQQDRADGKLKRGDVAPVRGAASGSN